MATGGYGRGGRGAALLQALSKQSRKPGDEEETGLPPAMQPLPQPVTTSPGIPMGRGALLANLMQSQTSKMASSSPTEPPMAKSEQQFSTTTPQPSSFPLPRGRGLAAMQQYVQSAIQAQSSMPMMMARGRGLPQQFQTSSTSSSSPSLTRPHPAETSASSTSEVTSPTAQDSSTPPSTQFSQLAIDRPAAVQRHGNEGKPFSLSSNYMRVRCQNAGVYQYHVQFSPVIDSKAMRCGMINEHRDVIGRAKAFDGTILFLPKRLPQQETLLKCTRRTDGAIVTICIKFVKVVPPESCCQVYNVLLRKIMSILTMCQVGRYYYNPHTPVSIPQHKLEVWPGYISAIREHEGGLLLLLDASHRVLRTETVLDVMHNTIQRNPRGFHDAVMKAVIGCVVLTRYNNKTYRIDDILWDKNPTHTFTCREKEISFHEYYRNNYNIDIKDLEQPLLLHKPKMTGKRQEERGGKEQTEMVCLVPELSYVTGLSDELRKDYSVMKDIAAHTRVTPAQRVVAMKKFVESVLNNQEAKEQLSSWGLELDRDTIELDGRELPRERIYVKGKKFDVAPNASWSNDICRSQVLVCVPLRNWIVFYTRRDSAKAGNYIQMMGRVCPVMGIEISQPSRVELRDDRTETFIKNIRDHINPQVQLVVIICPTSRDDRYSAIKKLCCVECPVPSQVINARTIDKQQKLKSVTEKIALQINCKLGGELWALDIPLTHLMVIGVDVFHDVSKGKRSIGGFVASINRACTRWFSRVCFQMAGQELVDGLKMCMISALKKYHEINHRLPDKIVMYRDGVSDGQLGVQTDHEVRQLEGCFQHFGTDYHPELTVVIVQKRISTRLFRRDRSRFDNPPPGTVMDHTIVRRDLYDFFLVSQHVGQGTVSPSHYVIVHDGSGMTPDKQQRLAYKFTHMYYNWPGTIRVPAPCQYAHKLASLVGKSIHKEPSPELSDRLFFL